MQWKTIAVPFALLFVLGCSTPKVPQPEGVDQQETSSDLDLAERAAQKAEQESRVGAPDEHFTHGERVAFFLRGIKKDSESRRLVEQYVKDGQ